MLNVSQHCERVGRGSSSRTCCRAAFTKNQQAKREVILQTKLILMQMAKKQPLAFVPMSKQPLHMLPRLLVAPNARCFLEVGDCATRRLAWRSCVPDACCHNGNFLALLAHDLAQSLAHALGHGVSCPPLVPACFACALRSRFTFRSTRGT